MKIVIFGLGSIGKRHAKILKEKLGHEVFAFRTGKGVQVNDLDVPELNSWEEVAAIRPDVAFITNPTRLHVETAVRCAGSGMHLFIEKPLSDSLKGVNDLESLCKKKKLASYVAYCLRFHPVIKKIKQLLDDKKVIHARVVCSSYLPDWRPGTDWKKNYSAIKKLGGGVLLDLSHEFDYIGYLFGSITKIKGAFGRISDVTKDSEDYADVLIRTVKGAEINLHLDYFSMKNERTIDISFNGGHISADLISGKVILIEGKKKKEYLLRIDRDDFTEEQTGYFFKNLNKPRMMNDISQAKILLAKILEFKNGKR
ncbi:MAG: Gfo/Idh/MocA family oxidoreductase [Candidatus Margulisiibacteriota bacterium]